MLRQLGFRRVLPVVQFLFYLILVGPDSIYLYRVLAGSGNPTWQPAALQEGIEFHPIYIDRETPTGVMIGGLLNLPAAVLGSVVAAPFRPEGTKGELLDRLFTAPLVVILWYVVGLWIDGRLDFVATRPARFSKLQLGVWWGLYTLSVVLFCLGLAGVVFLFLVVPQLPGRGPVEINLLPPFLFPLAWAGFFVVVCRSGLRRVRAAAPQKT